MLLTLESGFLLGEVALLGTGDQSLPIAGTKPVPLVGLNSGEAG
jgi:hypothetical protein